MAVKTLAVKYRPTTWDDIVEQEETKQILQQQLQSEEVKNAYLFCGPAGDGKTTTARIFANALNKGQGNPIEMDAASNSGVDDVKNITAQAHSKSLNSEYKVFIIDECHSISNTGWQAFLKLIEEPPAKSIFIFCTTDPQKIPKTILSRVQRYDFQRISQKGIVGRLQFILQSEGEEIDPEVNSAVDVIPHENEALEYIAKIADGGMRDAISLMDKALAYSENLTLENVVTALGAIDYDLMLDLTDAILEKKTQVILEHIEDIYSAGKDLKIFIKQYTQFVLDMLKYNLGCDWKYLNIPKLELYEKWLNTRMDDAEDTEDLLKCLVKVNAEIKYSSTPKADIEVSLLLLVTEAENDGDT